MRGGGGGSAAAATDAHTLSTSRTPSKFSYERPQRHLSMRRVAVKVSGGAGAQHVGCTAVL
jgi:hypothetical protein